MMPSDMAATPDRSIWKVALAPSRPPLREVLGLADQAIAAHPDVGEEQLAGGRGVHAHLAQRLALLEALHAGVEHEAEHLALRRGVALVELADEDDGVGVGTVGDERLAAVEHVLVAVAAGRRQHRAEGVGTGVGLGDRPGPDLVEGEEIEGPALLLADRALRGDGRSGETGGHAERGDQAGAVAAQLDDGDQAVAGVAPTAVAAGHLGAVGLGLLLGLDPVGETAARHLVHAEGGVELAEQVVGREVAVLEILLDGEELLVDEVAHRRAQHLMFVGPLVHDPDGTVVAMVIDVWMQHPTLRHINHEMFDSLKRWMGMPETIDEALPLELTVGAMDEAGIDLGLLAAWYGPEGSLIDNREVAGFVERYPERFRGVAGADLRRPMDAVRDLRHMVNDGFVALRVVPWLWELPPTDRRYYPAVRGPASISTSRSAPRSVTPVPCGRARPAGPFPTSTRWPSTSPSCGSSAATSATRGPPR